MQTGVEAHKMAESQNIEWKESWRDEYLKWICGFANAQGGKIYIGTRDDGTVIGVRNSKKLLEDIPNKIQYKLGIMADVNLLTKVDWIILKLSLVRGRFPSTMMENTIIEVAVQNRCCGEMH
jgi:ATP-dependent DNA helicase RecG